jgi:arsenical pump membrane protein
VREAFEQAWPAFALVAGLLLIGATAAREGLFAAAGTRAARLRGGGTVLLIVLLLVEAVVTAVLNLDTAVVFMTPVLLHAARARRLPEDPFLYGAVLMANSASLLLPGANLTNLIVLAHEPHLTGSTFAARLSPAWVVSVALTIALVSLLRGEVHPEPYEPPPFRPALGTASVAAAAVLVLVLARPALPVLVLGVAVALVAKTPARVVNPPLLLGVFAVAVLLGALARAVDLGPLTTGRWTTAWIAAGAAVLVNNLPAAVLLSAHPPAHPRALLLGLNLGPNLFVTGSLSAIFWLQVSRANGARPSIRRYLLLGAVLVPATLTASLLVTARV